MVIILKGVGNQKERVLYNYNYVFTFVYLLPKFNKKVFYYLIDIIMSMYVHF